MKYMLTALLVVHGLIHLMGTVNYMKLGTVQGLTYKITLLGWDIEKPVFGCTACCGLYSLSWIRLKQHHLGNLSFWSIHPALSGDSCSWI